AEFERVRRQRAGRTAALRAFHDKLARLRLFDPACGCGNFLVIAYRELRELETAVLAELHTETFNRPGLSRSDFNFDVGSLTN
ncbi:MAG: DNA methyltransferase, partial [Acetobacteraceae bacterium]